MSREIRRVPPDWQHPRDEQGRFVPLYDEEYDHAAQAWLARLAAWEAGSEERKEAEQNGYRYLWDWDSGTPDKESYRQRKWTEEEATYFQIYETVSEGTPISPIFATRDELRDWLIREGYSESASIRFAETGWAPSMVFVPGRGAFQGIEACSDEAQS